MSEEINYEDLFGQDTREVKNSSGNAKQPRNFDDDPTKKGQLRDSVNQYTVGRTIIRVIPDNHTDANGKFSPRSQRKILKLFTGRIKDTEDANNKYGINFKVPDESEYTLMGGLNLTPGQKELLSKVRKSLFYIRNFVGYGTQYKDVKDLVPRLDYFQQVVISYGKFLKFVPKGGTAVESPEFGHVRLFRYAKGSVSDGLDYFSKLNSAITNKYEAMGTMSFLEEYFSRKEGTFDKAICVTVDKQRIYNIGVSLEQVAPYTITAEDLETAVDLNTVYVPVTSFPEEMLTKLDRLLKPVCDLCDIHDAEQKAAAANK